mmetsp:Transcript_33715/g.61756  ORF Transcript_33715/g.61756 Transcript_33715/m.61756 type:complete len:175 (+) Transcript_33715:93-617(+)
MMSTWPCCELSESNLDKALLVDVISVAAEDLTEHLEDDAAWNSMQLPEVLATTGTLHRKEGIHVGERAKQSQTVGKTFTVTIHRTALKRKVGLRLAYNVAGDRCMVVKDIQKGLLVHDWNLIHPSKAIKAGDMIVAVNGQNHPTRMRQLFEDLDKELMTLVIQRGCRRGKIFES